MNHPVTVLRRILQKRAERIAAWAGEGPWYWQNSPDRGSYDFTYRRRRPVRFEDLDKLERMMEVLQRDTGVARVWVAGDWAHRSEGRSKEDDADRRALLEDLARGPAGSREYLSVSGGNPANPDNPGWSAVFYARRLPGYSDRPAVILADGDPSRLQTVANLIDMHTVEISERQARKTPTLFGPLTAEGAAQQEHDREISDRASRKAIVWGVIGGVLGGFGGTAIASLIAR